MYTAQWLTEASLRVCVGCHFQGVTYADGQVFPGGEQKCQDCTCSVSERMLSVRLMLNSSGLFLCVLFLQRGEVVCTARRCPSAPCAHPALDGCACRVCDGCNFNGRGCYNGERFPHPEDHCQSCFCLVLSYRRILYLSVHFKLGFWWNSDKEQLHPFDHVSTIFTLFNKLLKLLAWCIIHITTLGVILYTSSSSISSYLLQDEEVLVNVSN